MRTTLPALMLLTLWACSGSKNARLPGTPVAYTELASGALDPPSEDGGCTTPTVERFPSLNDAAPYLAEHLPGVASNLPHPSDSEQLVVTYLRYCSSGGPRVVLDGLRDVDGQVTAYLAVENPDTAIDISRRPYLIFTMPASADSLEVVSESRRRGGRR